VVLIVYSCSTPLALALCVCDAVLGIALNWGSGQAHCGDGFLLSKRHVSTDVCIISTVHEVAVRAALAVWPLGICGVGIKLPLATSKLLLGQPGHPSRILNWQQLLHVGIQVFAGVHKNQPTTI
jgi:hypothetical protein